MKIAVFGYSGSGKSTTAATLAKHFCLPLQYLDTVQFTKNWQIRDRAEAVKIAEDFLENSAWVIDGNYTEFAQVRRMKEADIIIFMNYSRLNCFVRALKRYFKFKGKTRESVGEGCAEKFDFEFAKWVLFEGRTKKRREHFNKICQDYKQKTTVVHNDKELNECINKIIMHAKD